MRAPDTIMALYWFSGGSIVGAGLDGDRLFLTKAKALSLLVSYQERALLQTDPEAVAFCDRAANELRAAIEAAERWARAAQPMAPIAA